MLIVKTKIKEIHFKEIFESLLIDKDHRLEKPSIKFCNVIGFSVGLLLNNRIGLAMSERLLICMGIACKVINSQIFGSTLQKDEFCAFIDLKAQSVNC